MKLLAIYLTILLSMVSLIEIDIRSALALPSEDLVIFQVQTGGPVSGTTGQEIILLYNQNTQDINISNWCISYSSSGNGATYSELACITPPNDQTQIWLKSESLMSLSTSAFDIANSGFVSDFSFNSGLATTGGHLIILDSQKSEKDKIGWGTAINPEGTAVPAHKAGEVLGRNIDSPTIDTDVNSVDFTSMLIKSPIESGLYEVEIEIDYCQNIAGVQSELPDGYLYDDLENCQLDICPNIEELQIELPDGYYIPQNQVNCLVIPLENFTLLITELLPNAPSYDTGLEFIEIFNPNNHRVNLKGYKLQLGPSFTKSYTFTEGEINPEEYKTFYDTSTGITLPNTAGSIRIISPAGNVVSESASYNNPSDSVSWSLVEDNWIFTNQITPGQANKPYIEQALNEVLGVTSVLGPCPVGKFRNPETNRCKNVQSAVSELTPCDDDEFRNPETNRCKNINSAVSQLSPCDDDEFRNPETNRCKKLSSSTSTLAACAEGKERNPETNRCRNIAVLSSSTDLPEVKDVSVESTTGKLNWPLIALVIAGTGGYLIYEWRHEIRQKSYQIRQT